MAGREGWKGEGGGGKLWEEILKKAASKTRAINWESVHESGI